jgi:hypothetical protein
MRRSKPTLKTPGTCKCHGDNKLVNVIESSGAQQGGPLRRGGITCD